MTTTKRKKVVKYRGSQTHGGGSKKKRRGAGNRGGRGLAGSGKRAHHHKQRVFKLFGKDYFGKKGFYNPNKKLIVREVNISFLEANFEKLQTNNLILEKNNVFEVDLAKLGYNKLLATGKPTKKYNIITKLFSKKAKEKIETAGGKIVS